MDDSFIILDEAQNTTREQMKMFLTRLGFGSKIVVTGDTTQIDLPDGKSSGLKEAMRVLRDVEGIGICQLTNADVVRHVMVQRIVKAYDEYDKKRAQRREEIRAERMKNEKKADKPRFEREKSEKPRHQYHIAPKKNEKTEKSRRFIRKLEGRK